MPLGFRARINFALGAGLLLLLLVAIGSVVTIRSYLQDRAAEDESQKGALALEQMVTRLRTAESQQRKFIITAAPADLDAYRATHGQVVNELGKLRAAPALHDDQALAPLAESVMRRLEVMQIAVRTRQEAGLDAAREIDGSDENRVLREHIDHLVARLRANESAALQATNERTQAGLRSIGAWIFAGLVLSVLLVGWAALLVNRQEAVRRLAEARLSDTIARSLAVTEIMGEGVITTDADGVILEVNAAAAALFGYPRGELRGRPVTDLMPVRFRAGFEQFFDILRSLPEGLKETGRDVRGLRKDGREIALQVSFGDVTVEGQRLFTSIVHDVTELKRISNALRASESLLRQVMDTVPALIAYLDARRCVRFHNRAYAESLGRRSEDIDGRTLREVLGNDLYERVLPQVDEAYQGYTVSYERSLPNAIGTMREYLIKYFPRYGEGDAAAKVTGVYVMGTDITDFKRIDRMKSEFISTVSHELRTPLTSIRGSLGLLAGGVAGALPPQARGLIGIAKDNCERLVRLVSDILDTEKIEAGEMHFDLTPTAIKPLLEQAVSANEGFAEQHQVRLVLDAPDGKLLAEVDADRFMQVVTNLLSNAVKFSPQGGAVTVRLAGRDGKVRVELHDEGPGIPPEFRDRIFQKFSQADTSDTRQKGGSGLGLNISRALVQRMGGRLDFTSAPGAGTTFYLELPECRILLLP